MKKCPLCESSRWTLGVPPYSLAERFLFRPILLRPFLCRNCQVRFHRFSLRSQDRRRARAEDLQETFLKSRESGEFEVLVDELREAEKRLQEDKDDGSSLRSKLG